MTAYLTDAQVAERWGVSTKTLRRVVATVPADLPGAPLVLGVERHRRRWNPDTLDEWIRAANAYRAKTAAPAPAKTAPVRSPRKPPRPAAPAVDPNLSPLERMRRRRNAPPSP